MKSIPKCGDAIRVTVPAAQAEPGDYIVYQVEDRDEAAGKFFARVWRQEDDGTVDTQHCAVITDADTVEAIPVRGAEAVARALIREAQLRVTDAVQYGWTWGSRADTTRGRVQAAELIRSAGVLAERYRGVERIKIPQLSRYDRPCFFDIGGERPRVFYGG